MTIETRIAKNGSQRYYVRDNNTGKRTAINVYAAADMLSSIRISNLVIINDAGDSFKVTCIEGQRNIFLADSNGNLYKTDYHYTHITLKDIATNNMSKRLYKTAEQIRDMEVEYAIDQVIITDEAFDIMVDAEINNANNTEKKVAVTSNNNNAEAIARIERRIQNLIAEREEIHDELDKAEADEEVAQWVIDELNADLNANIAEYYELHRKLDELNNNDDNNGTDTPSDNNTGTSDKIAKFEAGKTYFELDWMTGAAGEHSVKIERRTNKSVYINGDRYVIRVENGSEYIKFTYDYITTNKFYAKFVEQNDVTPTNDGPDIDGSEDDVDDNVFDLLPNIDELTDITGEPKSYVNGNTGNFAFTPDGNAVEHINIDGTLVTFINGQYQLPTVDITARYNAAKEFISVKLSANTYQRIWSIFADGKWHRVDLAGAIDALTKFNITVEEYIAEKNKADKTTAADVTAKQAAFDNAVAKSKSADEWDLLIINNEFIEFHNGKVSRIISDHYDGEITINGKRKTFRYRDGKKSRDEFLTCMANELIAADQYAVWNKFYGGRPISDSDDKYMVDIRPRLANGYSFTAQFSVADFDLAKAQVEKFKRMAGDMPYEALIKRNAFFGEIYYRHTLDGTEQFNPPEDEYGLTTGELVAHTATSRKEMIA